MRKRPTSLHYITSTVLVKVTSFTKQVFRQRQLLSQTYVRMCSVSSLLNVGEVKHFWHKRSTQVTLPLQSFYLPVSACLLSREELGAGENQWPCGHDGSVSVCSGVSAIWGDYVVGQQKNALLRCVAQVVKNLPAVQETWIQSLGCEDPLEKGMATHSGILTYRIP